MAHRQRHPGGGWPAIFYTIGKALEVGPWRLWKRMRSRNACKTCAVGMGGQSGGMVNEAGHFPDGEQRTGHIGRSRRSGVVADDEPLVGQAEHSLASEHEGWQA